VKHHRYNEQFEFVVDPVEFDKYSDKKLLQYCLGATMYMPGTTDFASAIYGIRNTRVSRRSYSALKTPADLRMFLLRKVTPCNY
jgi:hypothetical protein